VLKWQAWQRKLVYEIEFYEDRRGRSEIKDYLRSLAAKKDKDSRIKTEKINDYLVALRQRGIAAGEPFVKHLDGEIYELRPLRDRILFAARRENGFLLLHLFIKKTQKTPPREIEQAKRNLADYKERQENG
jgi:phage-related protein